MELFHANKQWSTRPADERFPSIQTLYDATKQYASVAAEREKVSIATLTTISEDGEVKLKGKGGVSARLSHWAFGQLAKFAGAPAEYLRGLPADLAAENVNNGLGKRSQDVVNLLFHTNGSLLTRAFTSDIYSRIWNWEVAERLMDYGNQGWIPATPTFNKREDGKDTALYASDHDLFAFITHPDRVIKEQGNPDGLRRGLIAINSEVGAAKLRLLRFLYREMCGNHIIWGAEDVIEMSARHVGNVRGNWGLWQAEVAKYLDATTAQDEQRVRSAQTKLIAGTKEDVLDALFQNRKLALSRKMLEASYAAVIPDQDGDPKTYWGLAQGITRHSQTVPYADERTKLDVAAGKVLAAAF